MLCCIIFFFIPYSFFYWVKVSLVLTESSYGIRPSVWANWMFDISNWQAHFLIFSSVNCFFLRPAYFSFSFNNRWTWFGCFKLVLARFDCQSNLDGVGCIVCCMFCSLYIHTSNSLPKPFHCSSCVRWGRFLCWSVHRMSLLGSHINVR